MKELVVILILVFVSADRVEAQSGQQKNQVATFDKIWKEFDLRYANFKLKEVDWDEVYERYRKRISNQLSEEDLFDICCEMLQELRDGHVTMEMIISGQEKFCGPPYDFTIETEFPTRTDRERFNRKIGQSLMNFGFGEAIRKELDEESNFQYRVSNTLGYLRVDGMIEALKLKKLNRHLDEAFAAFGDKAGVIIDLRLNGGGWDRAAYQFAGRLVKQSKVGHFRKTKKKGRDTFKPIKEWRLKPTGKYQYTGPVIILTSDFTASAAEVFLLAIKDLPNVRIVGDVTEGIFSEMHEFKVAKDWEVSLSHQQFFDRDMKNFEGIGITPDFLLVNRKVDIEAGKDVVLNKAAELLGQ